LANCAVKCQVDTKIGLVQVSCGYTATRITAHDFALSRLDPPEA
jgi:hypothetical protein